MNLCLLRAKPEPTIPLMKIREAKDFLVRQVSEQALLEGVSLTDLEKRMMYFTEGAGATEDPVELNREFEAQYDTAKYEKKVSCTMPTRDFARRARPPSKPGTTQSDA
jgi:hypothetical protein